MSTKVFKAYKRNTLTNERGHKTSFKTHTKSPKNEGINDFLVNIIANGYAIRASCTNFKFTIQD